MTEFFFLISVISEFGSYFFAISTSLLYAASRFALFLYSLDLVCHKQGHSRKPFINSIIKSWLQVRRSFIMTQTEHVTKFVYEYTALLAHVRPLALPPKSDGSARRP